MRHQYSWVEQKGNATSIVEDFQIEVLILVEERDLTAQIPLSHA